MDMIRYFCRWLQSRGRQNEALVIMGQCVITTYCTARSGIFLIICISIWVLGGKKMKKKKIKRRVHGSGKVLKEMLWRRKRGWSLPEWWAWNIVKTYFCKEGNRWGLSSMLSANSNLQGSSESEENKIEAILHPFKKPFVECIQSLSSTVEKHMLMQRLIDM